MTDKITLPPMSEESMTKAEMRPRTRPSRSRRPEMDDRPKPCADLLIAAVVLLTISTALFAIAYATADYSYRTGSGPDGGLLFVAWLSALFGIFNGIRGLYRLLANIDRKLGAR